MEFQTDPLYITTWQPANFLLELLLKTTTRRSIASLGESRLVTLTVVALCAVAGPVATAYVLDAFFRMTHAAACLAAGGVA